MQAAPSMDVSQPDLRTDYPHSPSSRARERHRETGVQPGLHILVMVNVPFPLQLEPFSVQEPEIVFPVAVPVRLSVAPGVPDTKNPKLPVTLPLKFPVKV